MRRVLVALSVIATLFLALVPQASSTPVATTEEEYLVYGRVFPDPHGCTAKTGQGSSQFAKGRVCATDFISLAELKGGVEFLEELYPRFVEFYTLHEDFKCNGERAKKAKEACEDAMSAGLPVTANQSGEGFTRDRQPLYMIRITDEAFPSKNKKFFVFPLSIHGIERAGAEGGTRAAEDLATWAACEVDEELPVCANEQPIPHPIMEATPKNSVTALDALRRSAVYFIYPNPDGWKRGERTTGTQFYQRYNGNGVDLNRDWPEQGYTFRPYTPWSEPETKYFGKVLQQNGPVDAHGDPKWA
ncbi:MAG: M14 family zinc carboxypeptidase, partial [Actinomycetota bacterium]